MSTPTPTLDPLDARLLDLVQREIPYDPRPFRVLGERVGASEEQVLARLRELRDQKRVIRQISAIFDTKALGYESSLVAARYDPARLDEAAAIVSQHPGVSHNYQRNNAFNLWYTLAVPPAPESRLGLQKTIDRLHELSGALSTRALPTLKLFKIGVQLSMAGEEGEAAADAAGGRGRAFTEADRAIAEQYTLGDLEKRLVLVLQQNLDLVPQPFDPWAQQAGCGVEELLAAARRFEERKQMRRFAAVLRHREAGFKANVMGVWQVEEAAAEQVGPVIAASPAVSHCYLRPAYPDWPYRIYSMVHGQSQEQCVAVLEELKGRTGLTYAALWSVKEYKKVRVRYFTPETGEWEARAMKNDE